MAIATPYLFFDGNCKEAMGFYKEAIGGQLEVMTYADGPPGAGCPDGDKSKVDQSRVMHACLRQGEMMLMASDYPNGGPEQGNNVHISLTCGSLEEIERVFPALAKGGKVLQPLENAFWGDRFGMLTDRYGFNWMLTCPLKKA